MVLAVAATGAIGIASLPLYALDYHHGDRPLFGVSFAVVMGALINAIVSGRVLGPTNRYYLRTQYRQMVVVLCFLVAWALLYFAALAPTVMPILTPKALALSVADNSYCHSLKPVTHITIAFATWGAFQLTFADRAVRARRRVVLEIRPAAGALSPRCGKSRRPQILALMGMALAALHPWLLVPSLAAITTFFVGFQRRMV
jgi:hypothetical protein